MLAGSSGDFIISDVDITTCRPSQWRIHGESDGGNRPPPKRARKIILNENENKSSCKVSNSVHADRLFISNSHFEGFEVILTP